MMCASKQRIQNRFAAPDLITSFVMPYRVDEYSAVMCLC